VFGVVCHVSIGIYVTPCFALLVYNLSNHIDIEETKAKVEAYRRENQTAIMGNRIRQVKGSHIVEHSCGMHGDGAIIKFDSVRSVNVGNIGIMNFLRNLESVHKREKAPRCL